MIHKSTPLTSVSRIINEESFRTFDVGCVVKVPAGSCNVAFYGEGKGLG